MVVKNMAVSDGRSINALWHGMQQRIADWGLLPLRLIIGYGFLAHGLAKMQKGPDSFIAILHAIGVPMPEMMAWLTILIELVGGIAMIAGAFVPLISIPMAAVLLVAMFTVHLPYGFSSIKLMSINASGAAHFGQPGYETDLLYLAGIVTLVISGCGPFSVDRFLARRRIQTT
jgi:putative oxidoreductase